jgi:secreted trypsin-like serine protease
MNGFNLLPKAIFVSMILASCGKLSRPTGESEVKIYNGVEVDSDHWITQTAASLQIFKDNGIAECSAAVIGPRALITNAHCFLRKDGSNANVSVAFAMYGNKAQSGISKVKWWNLYNNPATPLDMAIVELEDDVPKNIVPAFIAGENQPLGTGWIFGYGNNGYTDAPCFRKDVASGVKT